MFPDSEKRIESGNIFEIMNVEYGGTNHFEPGNSWVNEDCKKEIKLDRNTTALSPHFNRKSTALQPQIHRTLSAVFSCGETTKRVSGCYGYIFALFRSDDFGKIVNNLSQTWD
ncbi:MAG: hypothetical protein WC139_10255 [Candidatus Kapaibacterium sp.]